MIPKNYRYCLCDDCHTQDKFFNCIDANPSPRHDIMGESEENYGTLGCNGFGATIFMQKHKSDHDLIYFHLGKLDESNKFGPDAHINTDSKQI